MAKHHDTRLSKGGELQRPRSFQDEEPWRDMERMMERFGPSGIPNLLRDWPMFGDIGRLLQGQTPRVDVIDGDKEIKVRAELPGVDKEHLDVSVTEDAVLIKGSTHYEKEEEEENYFRSELTHGEFCRNVGLPASVDSDKVKAKFKDGILELTLPKTAERQRRTVKVE